MEENEEFHYSDERDERVKETAEVFTPTPMVQEMIDSLDFDFVNIDHQKTFLDTTCGSGQFLVELAKRGIKPQNIYGVDIMEDNITKTKERLKEIYGNSEEVEYHLNRNIVQGDALTYGYNFWDDRNKLNLW